MAGGASWSSGSDSSVSSSAGYIEHTVSRFDTLAGIAIKYGVEVADVKRMNGLVTDLQMFALKTLKIPLPGRHPPTRPSIGFIDSEPSPQGSRHRNPGAVLKLKDVSSHRGLEKRPVTSAMGLLRGYYGLTSSTTRYGEEGMEMAVYKSDSDYHSEEEPFSPLARFQDIPATREWSGSNDRPDLDSVARFPDLRLDTYRSNGIRSKSKEPHSYKSSKKSQLRGDENSGESVDLERGNERPVRRRGKADAGGSILSNTTVEQSTDSESEKAGSVMVPLGRSSVLRPKITTKVDILELETSSPQPVGSPPNSLFLSRETLTTSSAAARALSNTLLTSTVEGFISKIRRSTSVPSLQEEKRLFKGDSSALFTLGPVPSSQGGVISSVLEGLQVPTVRRSKEAVD